MAGELERYAQTQPAVAVPDLAEQVARGALAALPSDVAALRTAVGAALLALDGEGGGRRAATARRRRARQVALLAELLGLGADPLTDLAGHVRLVLAAPIGDPLWEDLRRFTTLLDELEGVRRRQQLQARLGRLDRSGRDLAAQIRGTEHVIATARRAFTETWG